MALAAALASACSRQAPRGTSHELDLPDVAGFLAPAPEKGEAFVRRAYRRGKLQVEVTVARMPSSPDDYRRWVEASAGFPQADLGLPPSLANGFYQCKADDPASCDLLVQLSSGVHLELRGGGTTTRADVTSLARELPLAAWAGPPRAP